MQNQAMLPGATERIQRAHRHAKPLIAGVLVLVALLFSAGCTRDPKVAAEKAYTQAQKLIQKKDTDAAIIELRRAIQLNPQMAKAHFALANLEFERGVLPTAFREYVATTKADPKNREAQIMVAEILTRARNFEEAKGQAQLILSSWPDDKTGMLLMAESKFGLQDYAGAQSLVNQVLASDPNNVRALTDLAYLQLADHKTADAQATLRKAWDIDPSSESVVALLSDTYELNGISSTAESVLKEAVNKRPDAVSLKVLLATYYMQHQRFNDAEPIYRQIQQASKDNPQYQGILAQFYLNAGRPKDAEAEYKRLLQANDSDLNSLHGLAQAYVQQKQYDEANTVLDKLLKKNPKDWQALALKGGIKLDRGDAATAVLDLQKAQKANPDDPAIGYNLARAYVSAGRLEEAKTALQEVLAKNPEYPDATTLMAALQLRTGQTADVIQELNKPGASKSSLQQSMLLSQAYVMRGDLPAAEAKLNSALSDAQTPKSKAAIFQALASIRYTQKRYSEAAALAIQALDAEPQSVPALYTLGMSSVAVKDPDKGIAAMAARLQKDSGWAEGYEVVARVAQAAQKYDVAVTYFNQALSLDPKLTSAMVGLADTYLMERRVDQAKPMFEKAVQQPDGRSYSMLRLGQICESQGDFAGAQSWYEKSIAENPDQVLAKNNLAWVYATHGGNIDVALKLAEEAREKAPRNPAIGDTLGWIYIQKGSYEAAVEALKGSLALDPNNPMYMYHLGTAYLRLGRSADARKELEAALRFPAFKDADDARKLLTQIQPGN